MSALLETIGSLAIVVSVALHLLVLRHRSHRR
ncbi:hypothetical protein LMG29739_03308 [Paraburkholderia solisilvae]|uniref:Uncharacterized protein n=1 Tax=Paraburkholderia solisilvae TaxID=624376 RepID=A0A6J5E0V9_9BURK|nr:hypothetical protein LMG29739_03308 [Paraburkholderia solisilvae]